jgi:hypothetical protein
MTAIAAPVAPAQVTVLDGTQAPPPPVSFTAADAAASKQFAQQLQSTTIGCRIRHKKLGTRRALTPEQIEKMAEQFDADTSTISGSKRLFDTRNPTYMAVVRIRRLATETWQQMTVPYPDRGVRLLRKNRVPEFEQKMNGYRQALVDAVAALQGEYEVLVKNAEKALGALFNPDDYPDKDDLATAFGLDWDYPSFDPPAFLKNAYPELYAQEQERIRGRFEEAVKLAEEGFTAEFAKLVGHLAEKLTGETEDGKPKIFRDSAVKNLTEFFEVFRALDTGSNAALAQLVDRAQQMVNGINPDDLRGEKNVLVRKSVAEGMAAIQTQLEGMLVTKPSRKLRKADDV